MSSVTMAADSTMEATGRERQQHRRRQQRQQALQLKRKLKAKARAKLAALRAERDVDSDVSDHDSDLDLDKPLLPLTGYVRDRQLLLTHMLRSISRRKLRAMLPDILKAVGVDDLRRLCLEQLEMMSRKRITRILHGAEPDSISSSGSEDEEADTDSDGVECLADSTSRQPQSSDESVGNTISSQSDLDTDLEEPTTQGDGESDVLVVPPPIMIIPIEDSPDDDTQSEQPQPQQPDEPPPQPAKHADTDRHEQSEVAVVDEEVEMPSQSDAAQPADTATQHTQPEAQPEAQHHNAQDDKQSAASKSDDREGGSGNNALEDGELTDSEAEDSYHSGDGIEITINTPDDDNLFSDERSQERPDKVQSSVPSPTGSDHDKDDKDTGKDAAPETAQEKPSILTEASDKEKSSILDEASAQETVKELSPSDVEIVCEVGKSSPRDRRMVQLREASSDSDDVTIEAVQERATAPMVRVKQEPGTSSKRTTSSPPATASIKRSKGASKPAAGGKGKSLAPAAVHEEVDPQDDIFSLDTMNLDEVDLPKPDGEGVFVSKNQMEILELEMRARAIKAMLKMHEEIEKKERLLKNQARKLKQQQQQLQNLVEPPVAKYAHLSKMEKAKLLAEKAKQQSEKAKQMKALIAKKQAEKLKLNAAVQQSLRQQVKDKESSRSGEKRKSSSTEKTSGKSSSQTPSTTKPAAAKSEPSRSDSQQTQPRSSSDQPQKSTKRFKLKR